MEMLELVLLLLGAVLVSSVLDQMMPRVSLPLVQIALGIVIAVIAGTPLQVNMDPELFLVLFIAPLLFDEAGRSGKTKAPSSPWQWASFWPRCWWSASSCTG